MQQCVCVFVFIYWKSRSTQLRVWLRVWLPGAGQNCNSSHSEAGCGTNDAKQEHICACCSVASEAQGILPAQRPHSRPLLDYSPTTSSQHRKGGVELIHRHPFERVLSSARSSNSSDRQVAGREKNLSIRPSVIHQPSHLCYSFFFFFFLICSEHCYLQERCFVTMLAALLGSIQATTIGPGS